MGPVVFKKVLKKAFSNFTSEYIYSDAWYDCLDNSDVPGISNCHLKFNTVGIDKAMCSDMKLLKAFFKTFLKTTGPVYKRFAKFCCFSSRHTSCMYSYGKSVTMPNFSYWKGCWTWWWSSSSISLNWNCIYFWKCILFERYTPACVIWFENMFILWEELKCTVRLRLCRPSLMIVLRWRCEFDRTLKSSYCQILYFFMGMKETCAHKWWCSE